MVAAIRESWTMDGRCGESVNRDEHGGEHLQRVE